MENMDYQKIKEKIKEEELQRKMREQKNKKIEAQLKKVEKLEFQFNREKIKLQAMIAKENNAMNSSNGTDSTDNINE
ncbi:MAG: hypothetical protein IJ414_01265 [Campylobacter sp.]|uniref:hypothetical protein n=1 Tax=Campylobacter sp. TaxID=205 RepID=UPI00259D2181|nr:hypothetical protein [Campylobacter sp.]MBQ8608758.1 hypothetical protein [Campylobacter sp.]